MSQRARNRVLGGMIAWDLFDQIYYVAKGGSDANSGRNTQVPVLTFGQALTLAAAATPTANNRFAIVCLDDGIYTEDLTMVEYVDIYAPNATITGEITAASYCSITFGEHRTANNTDGFIIDGIVNLNIDIFRFLGGTNSRWIFLNDTGATASIVDIRWSILDTFTPSGIYLDGLATSSISLDGDWINCKSSGRGVYVLDGIVTGRIGHIGGTGPGAGAGALRCDGGQTSLLISYIQTLARGLNITGGTCNVYLGKITGCATNHTIAAGAELYLNVLETVGGVDSVAVGSIFKKLDVQTEYKSTADFALRSPLASTNSPELSFLGDNAGTEVEGSIQLVTGADPYLQVSVDDDGTTPALTPVIDIYDDSILFPTDNAVDIGADGATRPKDYWGAGTVSAAGLADTTRTEHAVSTYAAGGALTEVGPLTDGQLVIGSTGVAPVAATLTAGAGVGIANAAGAITVTAGVIFAWIDATAATYGITAGNGYVVNRGGGVTLTLPATGALGETVKIVGKTGLWTVAQNANQAIEFGAFTTTIGVGGSLAATDAGDCMAFVCITAGASTRWRVESSVGNITVT